ncbi:MAG: outer membrane protein assembly factor BamA, partial [Syntrophales bacterium]|nr:outer membrane protein assembly factor BamA [Syntrophales bacterium]
MTAQYGRVREVLKMTCFGKNLLLSLLIAVFCLMACGNAFAAEVRVIALFPFDIYSKDRAANLQDEVYQGLAREITRSKNFRLVNREELLRVLGGKSIDEVTATAAAKETGADYAVMGSVSEFGEVLSADVRMIEIRTGKVLPGIIAQGSRAEGMTSLLSQLRTNLLLKISLEDRIAKIEFEGNRRIESGAIHQVLKSAQGGLYSEADLNADIKAIFKMGYFTDVSADVKESQDGKIITFLLQEKPQVTEISIQGNKKIGTSEIEGVLTVRAKQIINQEKVKADVMRIKNLYDSKGYYNAEVSDAVEKAGDKDLRIVFRIKENEQLYIRSILFEGNLAFSSKELKNMMTTNEWGIFHFLTDSGILKIEQLKQDVAKLNVFYLNNGFINAQVGEPQISYDAKGITVTISIQEGKQFRVGKVDITGDLLKTPHKDLLDKLKLNKQEFYNREIVLKDIEYLTQVCNDEGFAYADVVPRIQPQDKEQKVDVTYHLTKGHQVYFNRINITGNTKTRDKVIRRLLSVVEGDLYSSTKLKESYMELNRLRYFEEVNFQTEKGPSEELTDVTINIKEKPTGMISVGAGYSAQESVLLMAQVAQQNLFGRGQTLTLKASHGSRSTNYELNFVEPWLFDIPLWSKTDLWNFNRDYDTYSLQTNGFGTTFGYPLWGPWTGYLGYRLSENNVKDILDNASTYIKRQEGKTVTSMVSGSLVRDTTDDWMFPSTGSKNTLSVEHTGGILQGDTSFTRYGISSAWFHPLPLETVFAIRGRGGFMHANEGKEIPVYERYVLGGINSLRGLQDVGPRDPATGDVIGGLTMLNFNVEYIFPLLKNAGMKGVVFYDTGNTWESGWNLGDMRKTAGAGIRWYSPIGPLRLEWGYVLDPKENEPTSRW